MKKLLFLMLLVFPQCVFAEDLFLSEPKIQIKNGFVLFEQDQNVKTLQFAVYVVSSEFESKKFPEYRISLEEKKYNFKDENYRPGETRWMREISEDRGITFYRNQDEDGYGYRLMVEQMKAKARDGSTDRIYGIGWKYSF